MSLQKSFRLLRKNGGKIRGKDTTTGHWEIAGLILDKPFPVYPNGFPEDIIKRFEDSIGTKTLECSGIGDRDNQAVRR